MILSIVKTGRIETLCPHTKWWKTQHIPTGVQPFFWTEVLWFQWASSMHISWSGFVIISAISFMNSICSMSFCSLASTDTFWVNNENYEGHKIVWEQRCGYSDESEVYAGFYQGRWVASAEEAQWLRVEESRNTLFQILGDSEVAWLQEKYVESIQDVDETCLVPSTLESNMTTHYFP